LKSQELAMAGEMTPYSTDFFEALREAGLRSAREIVPLAVELIRPRSVIDLGCGDGTWLSVFQECGVEDIRGVDGEWVDQEALQMARDRFEIADLREPFRSGRRFDLVVSLEVAEHLPEARAGDFVESLTAHGPVVLFSAAIPKQGGEDHLNEQWPAYWVEHFLSRGYEAIDCIRPQVWENEKVAWWYAQNTLLFVKSDRIQEYPRLKSESEAPFSVSSVVHPQLFVERTGALEQRVAELLELEPGVVSLKKVLAALPSLAKYGVRQKLRRMAGR